MTFDSKQLIASLSAQPGIYRMLDAAGQALYVGKAKNLKKRVASYFQKTQTSPRIAHMLSRVASVEITVARSEAEALLLESNLIKTLAPRYNILFRDDKSYPYIALTRQRFPQLAFYRGTPDKRADYFGPFPSGGSVRESLQLLQKSLLLRTCENSVFRNRSRPCLLHQIKRCSAPCVGEIDEQAYAADVRLASLFLQGKAQELVNCLHAEMENASARLEFEAAARYRDQAMSMRAMIHKQYADSGKSEDLDVIVAIQRDGQLCVNLAMVRGGRHLGDKPQFPVVQGHSGAEVGAAEALAAFLRQHYARYPAPARLICQPSPPMTGEVADDRSGESGNTAALLTEIAGRPVSLYSARAQRHKAWLHMARDNALLAIRARNDTHEKQIERLSALGDLLQSEVPQRIECFDISHTQGEATVASCVACVDGAMKKSDYRRFNIREVTPGDDYGAMREAITRRYSSLTKVQPASEAVSADPTERRALKIPDLLLIDGGKGQVRAAGEALAELGISLPIIGVAKGEGRKAGLDRLIFGDGKETQERQPEDSALHLIQSIRDEAHRFAISGHRARRSKARRTSRLEAIDGIGAARRKRLVTHFGGISGVLDATMAELASVPGIGHELASQIYVQLRA